MPLWRKFHPWNILHIFSILLAIPCGTLVSPNLSLYNSGHPAQFPLHLYNIRVPSSVKVVKPTSTGSPKQTKSMRESSHRAGFSKYRCDLRCALCDLAIWLIVVYVRFVFRDFVEPFFPFFPFSPCSLSLPPSLPSFLHSFLHVRSTDTKSSKEKRPCSRQLLPLWRPGYNFALPPCRRSCSLLSDMDLHQHAPNDNLFGERPFSTEEMPLFSAVSLCERLATCKFKTPARVRGYPALFGSKIESYNFYHMPVMRTFHRQSIKSKPLMLWAAALLKDNCGGKKFQGRLNYLYTIALRKKYFTSSDPHHDISNHPIWWSIWHIYLAFHLAYLSGIPSGMSSDILSVISSDTFYLAYLLTFYLTFYLAFYLAYLLTFYLAYLLTFCLSYLLTFYLAYLLTFYLTFYLAYLLTFYLAYLPTFCLSYLLDILSGISSDILSVISSEILSGISSDILSVISSDTLSGVSSDILSGISSDILSGISSDILSGILSDILSGILSDILSGISSDILSGILSGVSSDILSGKAFGIGVEVRQRTLGVDGRGWGPAANTGRGWSWLRSGSEHWAWMVVVEVRQRTLGVDGRGWGPAANTGRGWSWLRSGSEHWAWMVVVEVRRRRKRRRSGSWHKI